MALYMKAHADEIDELIAKIKSQPVTGKSSDSEKKLASLWLLRNFAKLDGENTEPPKQPIQAATPAPRPKARGENEQSEIADGYSSSTARYVRADDYNLPLDIDNIQLEHRSRNDSAQYGLGILACQWLVIDKLANAEHAKDHNSEAMIARALDFAKERFHEMRQLQKKLGVSDNVLFEAIGRGNDSDAKRQLDLYERWD
jgi:hypothetical protein